MKMNTYDCFTLCKSRLLSYAVLSSLIGAMLGGSTAYAADAHLTPGGDIQGALNAAQPGDTIYLAAGDYYPASANPPYNTLMISGKNGSAQAWMTLRNEPGQHPILHLGGINAAANGISVQNSSYVRIHGLNLVGIDGSSPNGISAYGHHFQITGNVVHHFGGSGIGPSGSQILVEGNTVYDCCKTAHYGPSGISIYHAAMISTDNSGFAGPLGNPGDAYAVIIRNNTCYDNVQNNPTGGGLTIITDGNGIICDDWEDTQDTPSHPFTGRGLVANNICYDNGGRAVHIFSTDNMDVFNNTCYGNLRTLQTKDGEIDSYGKNNRFFNNIVFPTTNNRSGSNIGFGKSIWSNNLYFNETAYVPGTKDITGHDPLFVHAVADGNDSHDALADFHLKSGSPAIDSGTSAVNLSYDHVGSHRPQGNGYDIGAYESRLSNGRLAKKTHKAIQHK